MFKLKEHVVLSPEQKEFLLRFKPMKVIGCFDEPGTGKTLEILASICELLTNGQKAVVVVPPHLIPNWKHEVETFTYLELGKEIDIFPYTQLGKKVTSFEPYDLVAADEAHALKNMDAKRTQYFMTYLEESQPEYFIYATGTPLNNRIPEIYNFLLMLSDWSHVSPKITTLYPTYYQFCERFCHVKTVSYGSGVKYHGMKNVDELREYLKPWSIRRKYTQSLGMKTTKVIANYGEDTALARAWAEHASDGEIGGVDIVAKKEAAIATAPFTSKYLMDELEAGSGPIVVFSDHRDPAEMIYDSLTKEGYKGFMIRGGDNLDKRAALVKAFQNGEYDFISSTSAGYEGGTFTKSNFVVVNDLPWKASSLDQLRKRVDRKTQTRPCRCVYVVGSKAADQIINTLSAKLKVINAVVEG